jgi:hypothetical protein
LTLGCGPALGAVHGHRPPQLSREGVLRIDAGGQRSDLVGGKALVSRIASAASPS